MRAFQRDLSVLAEVNPDHLIDEAIQSVPPQLQQLKAALTQLEVKASGAPALSELQNIGEKLNNLEQKIVPAANDTKQ
jgi:hypothetical protein